MNIPLPISVKMTPEQCAAYAAEHGIDNTAAAIRDHVTASALTLLAEEFERIGSGQPPLGTVIRKVRA